MKTPIHFLVLVWLSLTSAATIQANTFLPWGDYLPPGVTLGMDYQAFSQSVPKAVNLDSPGTPINDSVQAFTLATAISNDKPVWNSLRFIFKNRLLVGVAYIEPISGGEAYEQPISTEMLTGFNTIQTVTYRMLINGTKKDKDVTLLSNAAINLEAYCLVDTEVMSVVIFKADQISLADVFGNIQ